MGKHALLNASSAHRWLTCPPLPRLENFFEKEVSEVANEGTDAHRLSEYKLRKVLGEKVRKPKLKYFDKDMDSYTDDYVNYIVETIENIKKSTKDPIVLIEQRLDFSNYVPDGFGTGDCIIIADKILHIIDLKYGRGVEVSAEENPQMMLYALGALNIYDALYDIDEVVMNIFQPRKYNISSSKKSVRELKNWADTVLKEKAELAFNGLGVVTYGPWCQFSNCNVVLRARKDYHDKLMRFQLCSPYLLNDAEIEEVLEHIDDLVKWAGEIKEYATKITLENDKEWSNYKLVEGRSIRKIKDEERVAEILKENGYNDIYKTSLLTLTELQKLLGKDKFNELLGDYIIKPEGKPTLVLKSDKRKEIVKHDVNKEFKVTEEK